MLLDAMESLHCKGVPLERFSPRTIGRDPHLYIARLPMTAKSKAFESTGDSLGLRTDFYSALPPGYPRGAGLAFLIQLGCFASYWLCGKFPIDQVPLIEIQKKLKRQKRELDISPEIMAVIHRLVEYDLEKAYPASADGVRALKEVLEG